MERITDEASLDILVMEKQAATAQLLKDPLGVHISPNYIKYLIRLCDLLILNVQLPVRLVAWYQYYFSTRQLVNLNHQELAEAFSRVQVLCMHAVSFVFSVSLIIGPCTGREVDRMMSMVFLIISTKAYSVEMSTGGSLQICVADILSFVNFAEVFFIFIFFFTKSVILHSFTVLVVGWIYTKHFT